MHTFEAHMLIFKNFLDYNLTIPLASTPHFLLETCLALMLAFVMVYLIIDVRRCQHEVKASLQPQSVQFKPSQDILPEGRILSTTNELVPCEYAKKRGRHRRTASNVSALFKTHQKDIRQLIGDFRLSQTCARQNVYTEKLTTLTPAQYVRLDRERQLRNRVPLSLTTLFNNARSQRFSEQQLREQFDCAKEDAMCSAVAHDVIRYVDSERVTDSLINMLNTIVEETTPENPPPMAGNLATLMYDIGNLEGVAAPPYKSPLSTTSTLQTTITEPADRVSEHSSPENRISELCLPESQ